VATSDGWGNRLLRYLGSRKNLAGCVLALGGLALYFIGVLGPIWPVVVVALYLVGALVVPSPRRAVVGHPGFDPDLVKEALDRLMHRVGGRTSPDIAAKVREIQQEIVGLLPFAAQFPPGSEDLFVIQRTATDYLPSALDAYLALPPEYATTRALQDGKTAKQVLLEQLQLIDSKMDEVADAVHQRDSDRLLASGRFLEERFGKGDLSVPGPPPS
jgi:hypothetical protein